MTLTFVVVFQAIEVLQFLTIAITVDSALPVDYENLESVWVLLNYACRPDVLLVSIGLDRVIVSALFLFLLVAYYS
jgi:hypothetical protein